MIAEHMHKTLGQPIIVENKPGASGSLAAQYIIDQPADGTILWLGTQAFTEINPNLFERSRAGRSTTSSRSSAASRRRSCSPFIRACRQTISPSS